MSISAIDPSSTNSLTGTLAGAQSPFQQRRTDFQQLAQSLQSGNLQGAQQAFAALQSLLQTQSGNASGNVSPPQSTTSGNPSPLATDLTAVGNALQSGNLSSAQQAFAKLAQDAQSTGQTHHHHHHAAPSQQSSNTSSILSSISVNSVGGTDSTSGTQVDVTA